jgi:hypothetical protein
MHTIERELIKVTKYKVQRKFSDRQDYLKSLLNSVSKLTDDDFDDLSLPAATWANAAVEAFNSKSDDIPDFEEVDYDGLEDNEINDPEDGGEAPGSEETDETSEPEEDPETDDAEDEPELPLEDEPEEAPVKAKGKKPAVGKNPGGKKTVAKKVEPEPEKAPPVKLSGKRRTPELGIVAPPHHKVKRPDEDVILDKWGCMEGSKNSRALFLFEKGATTAEVKEKVGGTYYNIMKKMVEDGHTLEKEGSIVTIIHKDTMAKAKKPIAKKKK